MLSPWLRVLNIPTKQNNPLLSDCDCTFLVDMVLVAQLCPTLCDAMALLSMEFSRQEYWSGLPFPSPGDLLDPGMESATPPFPVLEGRFFSTDSQMWQKKEES